MIEGEETKGKIIGHREREKEKKGLLLEFSVFVFDVSVRSTFWSCLYFLII